jgi:hypothetical protein
MAISLPQDRPSTTLRDQISVNWPPIWTKATRGSADKVRGEIGVLRYVHFSNSTSYSTSYKCFLVIEHESEHFVGTLVFHDPALHCQITGILKQHIGCLIKDIADLEIPQQGLKELERKLG